MSALHVEPSTVAVVTLDRDPEDNQPRGIYREVVDSFALPLTKSEAAYVLRAMADELDALAEAQA